MKGKPSFARVSCDQLTVALRPNVGTRDLVDAGFGGGERLMLAAGEKLVLRDAPDGRVLTRWRPKGEVGRDVYVVATQDDWVQVVVPYNWTTLYSGWVPAPLALEASDKTGGLLGALGSGGDNRSLMRCQTERPLFAVFDGVRHQVGTVFARAYLRTPDHSETVAEVDVDWVSPHDGWHLEVDLDDSCDVTSK
jgi:hypothetical protein